MASDNGSVGSPIDDADDEALPPLTAEEQSEILQMREDEGQIRNLLQRSCAGELEPVDVASRILALIHQRVAAAEAAKTLQAVAATTAAEAEAELAAVAEAAEATQAAAKEVPDTPGLESMGWILWGRVDEMAREDRRHHDALIAFINAFFPLLRTKPWTLWGSAVRDDRHNFILGPTFRESQQGAGPGVILAPGVPGATEEERRVRSWCNFCRFVARVTRDTEHKFSLYLLWFARQALEDCSWCPCDYPDAAILAMEDIVDVCGLHLLQLQTDFGQSGQGGDGTRRWSGKSGFCEERWLFWEAGLRTVAEDEAHRPAPIRQSARRTACRMQSIRVNLRALNSGSKVDTYTLKKVDQD